MDNEKEMAELFRTAADDMVCSYYDFRLLMENLSLNDKNRKRKAKQAVRFLCEKQDAAFVDGENSLRELRRLDQCPSLLARLEKILKDGEELLKTMLPEIFKPDSPEAAAMQRQIMDAMQAEIQRRAREAGEKLYRKQQELTSRQEKQEEMQKILQIRYMEEYSSITMTMHLYFDEKFKQITLSEFEYRLKMWREEQIAIVEKELLKLIPHENYYCEFSGTQHKMVTPEEGRKQAKELAKLIVTLVYETRMEIFQKFHCQPLGYILGNFESGINERFKIGNPEMECGDWAELFYHKLEQFIANSFFQNNNSFSILWMRKPGLFDVDFNLNWGEHNFIQIKSCIGSIYIDPWYSGGRQIIGEGSYGAQVYNPSGKKVLFYPDKRKIHYFDGPNSYRPIDLNSFKNPVGK